MPPTEERYGECRVPCSGDFDQFCGGPPEGGAFGGIASWFMTGNGPESKFLN